MEIQLIPLRQTDTPLFQQAWQIYQSAFPETEKRTLQQHIRTMQNPHFQCFAVSHTHIGVAGIITCWQLPEFCFGEHFAIRDTLRGTGIGRKALLQLLAQANRPFWLEVELPETDIQQRRIQFYQRMGFVCNPHAYQQPPYQKHLPPVPMLLMTHPQPITPQQMHRFVTEWHPVIYAQ